MTEVPVVGRIRLTYFGLLSAREVIVLHGGASH